MLHYKAPGKMLNKKKCWEKKKKSNVGTMFKLLSEASIIEKDGLFLPGHQRQQPALTIWV